MAWNPYTSPVDYVLMRGQRTPGLASVWGAGQPLKWDERAGYGYSGATLWFKGAGLSHFEVRIELRTPKDFEDWAVFMPILRAPAGTMPKAIAIWHPFLEMMKISAVTVEDFSQPTEKDPGAYEVVIKLAQWRRPKLTLVKPEASKASVSTDPVDKYIEELTVKVDDLLK
jgi:hypothetical protein